MSEKYFQLNKCICQGNCFVYHGTGSTYSRIILGAIHISMIYTKVYTKEIGKIQFVTELTILLNL